jgi:hypothetical protein
MFEERVTAFVDILGFSDLVARMPAEPSLFETVKGALEAVLSAEETLYAGTERLGVLTAGCYEVSESLTGEQPTVEQPDPDPQMIAFSDCYVLSDRPGHLARTIARVHRLALYLLRDGILTRGSIRQGPLHHEGRVVFGQALIDAYLDEKNIAKMPRILLEKKLAIAFRRTEADAFLEQEELFAGSLIRDDDDGLHSLNMFVPVVERTDVGVVSYRAAWAKVFSGVGAHLTSILEHERAIGRTCHQEKHRWVVERFNTAMAEGGLGVAPVALLDGVAR